MMARESEIIDPPVSGSRGAQTMISSINIQGYRGFQQFEMSSLGRVNLLVGTNNSGKTSVLEAIFLLSSTGDPFAMWQMLWRRGERLPQGPMQENDRPQRRARIELDVAHMFYGHEVQPGSTIRISSENQSSHRMMQYKVEEVSPRDQPDLFGVEDEGPLTSRLVLSMEGIPKPQALIVPLTRSGGIHSEMLETASRRGRMRMSDVTSNYFVTTDSLGSDELIGLWNKIALTSSEELVLRALQFLDPKIERIASQAPVSPYYLPLSRGGFIIKHRDFEQPIPIGSMGDGMWRMLAMAIAITQCKGGVLLVDEIDTGLHYTVMAKMWRLIFNAAKEFDVQVFATTHSSDCVYSLAELWKEVDQNNTISLQRIEPNKSHSIPYNEEELAIAAEKEIEVR